MTRIKFAAAMGALGLLLASGAVQAQLYHYKDANGRTVYSDTPPPPGTPAGNILKSPKLNPNSPAPAAAAADATGAPGKDGKKEKDGPKSVADREADYKKRMADAEKKGKEDADKAKAEQSRQEQCAGMKSNLASLQAGQRIRKTDANGNPYYIDDSERSADIAKAQQNMADSKCSG